MADREVRIRFTGDSKVLKGAAGEARKVFQQLIDDQNDARGAGEKWAAAQKIAAEKMRAEMKAVSEAADVLADALGPEMVQAIEASGRTVEDEVQKLQRLGLTLTDVTRDSKLIAEGMKELDDASRQGLGAVGDGFKKVSVESDKARSATQSFAGNVAGDIAATTAQFGPLGEGIGQLTEGLLAGETGFKNLALAAGGMGAIALVMNAITKATAAAEKKTNDLKDAHKALAEGQLEEAARKIIDSYEGLMSIAEEAGVSMYDMTSAIMGNEKAMIRVIDALNRYDESGVKFMAGGQGIIAQLQQAQQDWIDSGNAVKYNESAVRAVMGAIRPLAGTLEGTSSSVKGLTDDWNELTDALDADDAFNNVMLGFGELQDELARLKEEYESGGMTAEELWRRVDLAANGQKRAVADYLAEIAKLPAEQATEIMALIDEGSYAEVQRRLSEIERAREAKVYFSQFDLGDKQNNRRYAGGTRSAAPGLALVGENGPELVNFRGGESVLPAGPTRAALGGAPTYNITVSTLKADADIGRVIVDAINAHTRNGGRGVA